METIWRSSSGALTLRRREARMSKATLSTARTEKKISAASAPKASVFLTASNLS